MIDEIVQQQIGIFKFFIAPVQVITKFKRVVARIRIG